MSIATLIHPTGQHRAVDDNARLRAANERLLAQTAAADRTFAELHCWWQYAEKKAGDAETVVVCQAGELDDLRDQLAGLQRELRETRAALANATAVHVPAGHRDVPDGDRATQPIPSGEHWTNPARPAAGPTVPVLTLHKARDSHAA